MVSLLEGFGLGLDDEPEMEEPAEEQVEPAGSDPPESGPVGKTVFCEPGGHEWQLRPGARGRVPKACPEHRGRTSGTGRVSKPRGAKLEARVAALETDLMTEAVTVGRTIAPVMPCTSYVIMARAEKTAAALARLAATNPKLLTVLETGAKIVPMLDLGETLVMLGVALAVDSGRLKPDSMVSVVSGVSTVWHDINDDSITRAARGEQAFVQTSMYQGMPVQHVPPRFETITP